MQFCICPNTIPCFRIRGSVIWRIWVEVILCSLYAAGIVLADKYYHDTFERYNWKLPENLLSVLGVATGMLLVFRTNTSYERYYEGRKIWSDMATSIRSLTRTFWVMIDSRSQPQIIIEKISVVNLLIAFAYATKHYLREEYSYDEDDLLEFAGHLPHLLTPTSQEPLHAQENLRDVLNSQRQRKAEEDDTRRESVEDRLRSLKKSVARMRRQSSVRNLETVVRSNIPLEITYFLSSYSKSCKDRQLIDAPTVRVIDTAITSLVHCLGGFERIRSTPIPVAYLVHLTHVTWIVLLMLPLHWTNIGWLAVPLMFIASYILLGILAIGTEIEDPFGYDYNDLNLDEYCIVLHKEAMAVTAQPMPAHDKWMFTPENHPIPQSPHLTAMDLLQMSAVEIRRILFQGRSFKLSDKRSGKVAEPIPEEPDSNFTPDEFNILETTETTV